MVTTPTATPTATTASTRTASTRIASRARPGASAPATSSTRDLLLDTAERLYAERGLAQVSNRQIAEAAGQANNSVVAYHVGTKADLVAALCARQAEPVARATREMVAALRGTDATTRDHVASLVAPFVRLLAARGQPSWTARFAAQVLADPVYGPRLLWQAELTAAHREASAAAWSAAPPVPPEVVDLRLQMMRIVVVHTCAEQEGAAAARGATADWARVEAALVDAVTGMLLAPVGAGHAGPRATSGVADIPDPAGAPRHRHRAQRPARIGR